MIDILRETSNFNEVHELHRVEQVGEFVVVNLYPDFRHGRSPMDRNEQLRREFARTLAACREGRATSRDFLAFAVPYALEDWVEPTLRADLDLLSLAADEVGLGDVGEEAFREAVEQAMSRAQPAEEPALADAAD